MILVEDKYDDQQTYTGHPQDKKVLQVFFVKLQFKHKN